MPSQRLDSFTDRLTELIPQLMRECTRYESNYLTQGVITLQQYIALECLRSLGTSQMSQLASAMNIKMSSMTGLVDRLIKQELVQRERSEEDRRSVYVGLSPKGRKVLNEIRQQKKKGIASLFKRLSQRERSQYLEIIEKLVGELSLKK